MWYEEDKEFVTHARNIIEKKRLDGNPIMPLLKTVNVSNMVLIKTQQIFIIIIMFLGLP